MDKFDEVLNKLNELKIVQKSMDWCENIPEEIWKEYFMEYNRVDSGLFIDKYRWYELSTEVIEIDKRYLGVESITDLFSESSSVEDIFHTLKFFEMKAVPTITYEKL